MAPKGQFNILEYYRLFIKTGSQCGPPPVIDRMTSQMDMTSLTTGQTTYTCDTGYLQDTGTGSSVCSGTNGWTQPSLICKGIK